VEIDWGQTLGTLFTGGVLWKGLEAVFKFLMGRRARADARERFVQQHLDPLLKATDELFSKLRSLAMVDFRPLHHVRAGRRCLRNHDLGSLAYLFGIFWARIERIRHDGMSDQMAATKRGKQLVAFLDCLESGRVRIVNRIQQRAIGECLLDEKNQPKTFIAFVAEFEAQDGASRTWLAPLLTVITRTLHTTERQELLRYTTVLGAMIETLDPKHYITGSNRPPFHQRITKRTWNDLKHRVFKVYLPFVKDVPKYIGPPKRRPVVRRGGAA
jgi:hypothetical protein